MSSSLDSCMELASSDVKLTPLKDLAEFQRGDSITKKSSEEGEYPVISGGQKPAYYINQFNRTGETITVAGSGAYAGFVMYWNKPIFVSDAFSIKVDEQRLLPRYAYHFLLSMQDKIHALKLGSGVPHVYAKDVAKIPIPTPFPNNRIQSLAIQAGIVRILDSFSGLVDKLEAELICRKRQYEYYLNHLLSFDHDDTSGSVQWLKLGDIGTFYRGISFQKKHLVESGVPCIHYGQLYTYYGTATDHTKSFISENMACNKKLAKTGDLVIATTSENLEDVGKATVWLGSEDILVSNDACFFRHNQNPKYIAYIFKTNAFFKDKCKYCTGSKVVRISTNSLANLTVPIPPLAEQERIVTILDNYSRHYHELKDELATEITNRRKQYEYYREQLLSFNKL